MDDPSFGESLIGRCHDLEPRLSRYYGSGYEEFGECFEEQLRLAIDQKVDVRDIDESSDLYMITYLRCVTSSYLRAHEADYVGFLADGYSSIEEFCLREVDPMYRECDELQIIALTKSLRVPVEIFYLDRSEGDAPNVLRLPEEHDSPKAKRYQGPHITLLYKPGHYDLLYLS